MTMHYNTNKTQAEIDREAFERGYIAYLKMSFVTSLIIGLCLLASGHIGKAIDQDFGIYKANQAKTSHK